MSVAFGYFAFAVGIPLVLIGGPLNAFLIFAFTLVVARASTAFILHCVGMDSRKFDVLTFLALLAGDVAAGFAGCVGLAAAWSGRI